MHPQALRTLAGLRKGADRLLVSGVRTLSELPPDVALDTLFWVRDGRDRFDVEAARRRLASGILEGVRAPWLAALAAVPRLAAMPIQEHRRIFELENAVTRRHRIGDDGHTVAELAAEVVVPRSRWLEAHATPARPHRRILVLHRLADPGNVGSLIRTALGFGFAEVWLLGCPLGPKVVRASTGAVLGATLVHADWPACEAYLRRHRVELLVADIAPAPPKRRGSSSLHYWRPATPRESLPPPDPRQPLALVLSSEARGVTPELPRAAKRVSLHIGSGVQSLNVSAGALLRSALRDPLCGREMALTACSAGSALMYALAGAHPG